MNAQPFIDFAQKHGPAIIQKGYDGYCSLDMDALCDELATTLALRDAGRALVQLADITWALSKVLATHPSAEPNAWKVFTTVCTACGVSSEFAYQCMAVLYQYRVKVDVRDPVEEQFVLLEAVLPPTPDDSVLGQLLQPVDRAVRYALPHSVRVRATVLLLSQLLFVAEHAANIDHAEESLFLFNGRALNIRAWAEVILDDLVQYKLVPFPVTLDELQLMDRLAVALPGIALTAVMGVELAPTLATLVEEYWS